MHESSYSIAKFSENISQTTTISSFQKLFSDPKLDLTIHFESNLPISLAWDARSDAFTGYQSFTIFPKLVINGELYEASFKRDLVMPPTFDGLETALLSALKESLKTVARVWD